MVRDSRRIAKQREGVNRLASLSAVVPIIANWTLPNTTIWRAVEIAFLVITFALWGRVIALRVREHRAAGRPTDAWTILRASIAVEGAVILVAIIVVAFVATKLL